MLELIFNLITIVGGLATLIGYGILKLTMFILRGIFQGVPLIIRAMFEEIKFTREINKKLKNDPKFKELYK